MQGFLNFSFKEPQLSNISLISVKLVAFFISFYSFNSFKSPLTISLVNLSVLLLFLVFKVNIKKDGFKFFLFPVIVKTQYRHSFKQVYCSFL